MNITSALWDVIEKHEVSGLDKNDDRLPSVICIACRLKLKEYSEDDFNIVIDVFDYSKLGGLAPQTRANPSCVCMVCMIATSLPPRSRPLK